MAEARITAHVLEVVREGCQTGRDASVHRHFRRTRVARGLVAWAIARLRGRPVLVYAHGEELTNWGRGRKFALMRFVFGHADAVLANSDFTRDTLSGLLDVDPGRIAVIYPTVDEDRFRPGLAADDLRARRRGHAR